MSAHDHKADARAAFKGLIIGAIVLLAFMYTVVQVTNRNYASHSTAAP
jgi:hypothetical protein